MPENTVSVTRPGYFGNPFRVGDYVRLGSGGDGLVYMITREAKYATASYIYIATISEAVAIFVEYLKRYPLSPEKIAQLRGKNLACWCKVGDPCHADELLRIANQ